MAPRAGQIRWAAAALLALALAASGCGGGGKREEEPSAAELVRLTTERTAKLESFHFRFEVENPARSTTGLAVTFAEGDVAVPDRMQARVAGTFGGISISSELVYVAPKQYLKEPFTRRWREITTELTLIDLFDPKRGVLPVIRRSVRLERAGSERTGGVEAYRLRGQVHAREAGRLVAATPDDRFVDVEVLVGKEDFVLREIRLEGPVSASEPSGIARTIELSRLDEEVTITPPVP